MKTPLFLVGVLLALDVSADSVKLEVYTPNDAGGYIVLTHESCQLEKFKKTYPYRGYATTSDVDVVHEGCYDVPSIESAPQLPGYKVFSMVNFIDADGLRVEWPLHIFSSTKETDVEEPTLWKN